MNLIDGKALAAEIRAKVKTEVAAHGILPKLAVLLIGDNPASHLYVRMKEQAAAEAGIATDIRRVPETITDDEAIAIIASWNADTTVHAILVQVPLPEGHDTDRIVNAIDPKKDVDGFHPINKEKLLLGTATIFPPVYEAVLRLIGATGADLRSAKAVIIANSDVFAEPLGAILTRGGCTVTTFTPQTVERAVVLDADIIVVAVGRPGFLTRDMIKSGACVIDVGTNKLPNGKTVGDVDAEHLQDIKGWLSPVPGGVGPMTVALLLKNVVTLATPPTPASTSGASA